MFITFQTTSTAIQPLMSLALLLGALWISYVDWTPRVMESFAGRGRMAEFVLRLNNFDLECSESRTSGRMMLGDTFAAMVSPGNTSISRLPAFKVRYYNIPV